mgnify:CR=1 FL=1
MIYTRVDGFGQIQPYFISHLQISPYPLAGFIGDGLVCEMLDTETCSTDCGVIATRTAEVGYLPCW